MTLLSPDRRDLILAIPKTGGSARRHHLLRKGWHELTFKAQHHRLADIPRLFGLDLKSLRHIFAIIRDPWARELSHWAHAHQSVNVGLMGGLGKQIARRHDTVNTFVQDWRGTPLWYYERGWYNEFYGHTGDGTWDEYARCDGYRYWITQHDGTIPDNVVIIPVKQQDEILSEHTGRRIEIPHMNGSKHATPAEAYNQDGWSAVEDMYWWTLTHYKEACDAH